VNRIDRLFAITVLLQSRSRVRAEDLARRFAISRRTVYRDIAALNEGGIPVVSLPGEGYALMEGFSLPPLAFSSVEAVALVLGARLLAEQAAGELQEGAEHGLAKIMAALPARTRGEVARKSALVGFIAPPGRFDLEDPRLRLLQEAICEQRLLRLRYHSYSRDEVAERTVEPERLYYSDGVWYLAGYCQLREGARAFRLERIEHATLLDERFPPRSTAPQHSEQVEVRVRFSGSILRWVRERQHYGFRLEAPSADGAVIMTYRVDTLEEFLPWLRAWGPAAEVIAPPALRAIVRQEAR